MSATQPDYPSYRVDMNVSNATNGWVLGVSTLGHSTTLRATPSVGAILAEMKTTDGNSRFISSQIGRGRNDEFGQIQAGTATIILDNGDGAFSPNNPGSPYYPYVLPRRQIMVSARYATSGAWQPLYYGYVDSIKPVDNGPLDGNVQLGCSDWLGRAAGALITYTGVQELDTVRFANLVAQIGSDNLPTAVVGPPNNTENVMALAYAGVAGLGALQQITDATRGMIYHARDGTIAYRTRHGKFTSVGPFHAGGYLFDQVGLNAAANVCPYQEPLDYDLTLQYLYNNVIVTPANNIPVTVGDGFSQTFYGRVDLPLSLPLLDPARATTLATTLCTRYKTPLPRVHSLVIDGDAWANGGRTPLWDTLFQMELGDTVRVVKRQPASLSIDRTMFIEHIQHDIKAGNAGHTITLQLSDYVQSGPRPWILGTSQLGVNTNFAY